MAVRSVSYDCRYVECGVAKKGCTAFSINYARYYAFAEIAELYGITIDSLYRKSSIAYDNYAQRLASVYEYTRSPEDFLRAELAFQKLMKSDGFSARDKFEYAYIHAEMLYELYKREGYEFEAKICLDYIKELKNKMK